MKSPSLTDPLPPVSLTAFAKVGEDAMRYLRSLADIANGHAKRRTEKAVATDADELAGALDPFRLARDLPAYLVDVAQRQVLFLDTLRQRGDNFLVHEEIGAKPVLAFAFETILNGESLPRPVNYSLVRIVPPDGEPARENARPYIIIDPRAGHGSGIGGFKDQSEVGCALRGGHPVYFVVFSRHPEAGQTLADVCAAEAEFVREVRRRHAKAPKPIVIGNCQGGWATMLLAATHPDITGPIVANGAPLSFWSGRLGRNPMRYLGGLYGGIVPALLLADLGAGHFDGANLVLNFEMGNPGRTWWAKHFEAFHEIDREAERYLEFERWWGSFYFMSEAEIRWIVEQLFVGNRLARGQAQLDERTHVDLRNIQSPIIVFASHGDNITPPQQALGWIPDLYRSTDEIRVRGQRIVYTIHPNVGHLGIFVSSEVAGKEHQQIFSTLKAIEALSPGLYEMVIRSEEGEGVAKRFRVAFEERRVEDVLALFGERRDEEAFGAVSRLADLGVEAYELTARPWIRSLVTPQSAKAFFAMNPLRVQRYAFSSRNPALAALPGLAHRVRERRAALSADSPFLRLEALAGEFVTRFWDGLRDANEAFVECAFHAVYDSPAARAAGASHARRVSDAPMEDLRGLASVQEALDHLEEGGFAEGVIRMLVLLARAAGSVRRSRLERSNLMMETQPPFAALAPKQKTRIVHKQGIIVNFAAEDALRTLPSLLREPAERRRALALCLEVAGPVEEMDPEVVETFRRFARILEVESVVERREVPAGRAVARVTRARAAPPATGGKSRRSARSPKPAKGRRR